MGKTLENYAVFRENKRLGHALHALAELRETYAAVLQELDELSAAVQVADQFIGIGIDLT